jgi:hypothetical protein
MPDGNSHPELLGRAGVKCAAFPLLQPHDSDDRRHGQNETHQLNQILWEPMQFIARQVSVFLVH